MMDGAALAVKCVSWHPGSPAMLPPVVVCAATAPEGGQVTGGVLDADTELGDEMRLARVKLAATFILDEYLLCQSSVDAALIVEELGAPE